MPVEHFDWLRVALHAPVVDGVVGHQGYGVEGDPLPESDVVGHGVGLHLALHLDVKDLKGFGGWWGRVIETHIQGVLARMGTAAGAEA